MAIADQPKVLGLAIAESWLRLRRRVFGRRRTIGFSGTTPERLVLAAPDLHTADPTIAQDIYAGIFHFAGRTAHISDTNVFRTQPPSSEWQRELDSFRWLLHLHAARDAVSATNAQVLIRDWIEVNRGIASGPAWEIETTGWRLISWLCHSVLIVENTDYDAYWRFLRSIGQHVRFLRKTVGQAPDGMPRLLGHVALAYAAVCVEGKKFSKRGIWKNLNSELDHQILPDGGHISRNPALLPEILALLLPLRQSLAKLGEAPSAELISAIDRLSTGIRFYRMGDGAIARFNGVTVTPSDLVTTVLRYDDTLGEAPQNAGHSGFQRMATNGTVLVMDTGRPVRGELSVYAHAGCLSFEMSSDRAPVIVNCGVPPSGNADAFMAGRSTAAHSTLTLNDSSSCRFKLDGVMGRYLENRVISGPGRVDCERKDVNGDKSVTATHDGYLRSYGLLHERAVTLSADGMTVMGMDRIVPPGKRGARRPGKDKFAIRFHLHPSVSASKSSDGRSVLLSCASGIRWQFTCIDAEPQLEESIFFAVSAGGRRTRQIVLYGAASNKSEIRWILENRSQRS